MISVYLREQQRYTQKELIEKLACTEEKTVRILRRLKAYGILKTVKASDAQRNLTDLLEEDVEVTDVEVGEDKYLFVFHVCRSHYDRRTSVEVFSKILTRLYSTSCQVENCNQGFREVQF